MKHEGEGEDVKFKQTRLKAIPLSKSDFSGNKYQDILRPFFSANGTVNRKIVYI